MLWCVCSHWGVSKHARWDWAFTWAHSAVMLYWERQLGGEEGQLGSCSLPSTLVMKRSTDWMTRSKKWSFPRLNMAWKETASRSSDMLRIHLTSCLHKTKTGQNPYHESLLRTCVIMLTSLLPWEMYRQMDVDSKAAPIDGVVSPYRCQVPWWDMKSSMSLGTSNTGCPVPTVQKSSGWSLT